MYTPPTTEYVDLSAYGCLFTANDGYGAGDIIDII